MPDGDCLTVGGSFFVSPAGTAAVTVTNWAQSVFGKRENIFISNPLLKKLQ